MFSLLTLYRHGSTYTLELRPESTEEVRLAVAPHYRVGVNDAGELRVFFETGSYGIQVHDAVSAGVCSLLRICTLDPEQQAA